MTDQKEIERVAWIHRELDRACALGAAEGWKITINGVVTTYTAAEVKRWPEMKAKLVTRLRSSGAEAVAWVEDGVHESGLGPGNTWTFSPSRCADDHAKNSVRRGLCMYREQLPEPTLVTDAKLKDIARRVFDTGPVDHSALTGLKDDDHPTAPSFQYVPGSYRTIIWGDPDRRVDPYRGSDLAAEQAIAARTYEHPDNVRARKVAALCAELDRPVGFPSEARSERALPRTNGMVRL